jgi:hypothetical protein
MGNNVRFHAAIGAARHLDTVFLDIEFEYLVRETENPPYQHNPPTQTISTIRTVRMTESPLYLNAVIGASV